MSEDTYVTFSGLPITLEFEWPFHRSHGGSDFYVLHGTARLEDGSGRYASIAVQMSQTVHDVLASESEAACKPAAVNAVRKAADVRDIEFIRSSKKQPILLSSRQYSIVTQKFTFQNATDDEIKDHLARTTYWRGKLGKVPAAVADPVEALYLAATLERLKAAAEKLAAEGVIRIADESMEAAPKLFDHAESFESKMLHSMEELDAKHAFEKA